MKVKNIHTGVEAEIVNIKTLENGEKNPMLDVFTLKYDADGKSHNWEKELLYSSWTPIFSNGKK